MSEFPAGFRPVVLTAEETARREAEKQATNQQINYQTTSNQDQTTLQVDNKTVELDVARENIMNGDVLVESPTALDMFVNTEKEAYVIEDTNFKNDLTGQTEIIAKEITDASNTNQGIDMIFN